MFSKGAASKNEPRRSIIQVNAKIFFVNIYYVVISFVHREDYHFVHISVIGSLP